MKMYTYETILGDITIIENNGYITHLYLSDKPDNLNFDVEETEVIKTAYIQLCEYFDKKRTSFDLPLNPEGSEFSKKVWNALLNIPYGKVISYKDVASNINNPKAYRAVGNANGKNPIPIIIPCHRVIKNDKTIGGYSIGLDLKNKLLEIEDIKIENRR